jgi:UDP-N-acetylmuramyl pentapeptide phosphotransferase/UDP-N-acetylglucosamine-1-phosphate transferase
MISILLGFITAFVIVFVSAPALIRVARLKGLVDYPDDDRKIHKRLIPTIGGVIIFAGTMIAYLLWYPFYQVGDFKYIAAAIMILFFIGIKDDLVGTAPVKKLIGHIAVAFILVIIAGIKITNMYGIFGINEIPDWASILLSLFTYTVVVNAFNLIDGVDGLAAGVGFIACTSFGLWFYFAGATDNSILAFSLAGALLGFLIFNFEPARVFMGDSGSLTIGLIVSVLSIKLIEYPTEQIPSSMVYVSKPVFAMAVLAYPLIDTLRVFVIRTFQGNSPFSADRNHLHHKLIDFGLSHSKSVLIVYGFSILMVLMATFIKIETNLLFALLSFLVVLFSQIPLIIEKLAKKKTA